MIEKAWMIVVCCTLLYWNVLVTCHRSCLFTSCFDAGRIRCRCSRRPFSKLQHMKHNQPIERKFNAILLLYDNLFNHFCKTIGIIESSNKYRYLNRYINIYFYWYYSNILTFKLLSFEQILLGNRLFACSAELLLFRYIYSCFVVQKLATYLLWF